MYILYIYIRIYTYISYHHEYVSFMFIILTEKSCWMGCLRWAICEPLPYLAELTPTLGDRPIDDGAFDY